MKIFQKQNTSILTHLMTIPHQNSAAASLPENNVCDTWIRVLRLIQHDHIVGSPQKLAAELEQLQVPRVRHSQETPVILTPTVFVNSTTRVRLTAWGLHWGPCHLRPLQDRLLVNTRRWFMAHSPRKHATNSLEQLVGHIRNRQEKHGPHYLENQYYGK